MLFEKILILTVLILMSAFFSGIEIALFSLSRLKIKHLVKKKVKNARILENIKSDSHSLLITILIGNNLANIGASAFATVITIDIVSKIGIARGGAVGIATGIMTLIILVFGEITPKTMATRHAEKISLIVARPIKFLTLLLLPVVKVLDFISRTLTSSRDVTKPIVTEEELKTIVKVGEEAGQIKTTESEMIHKIFKFDNINVSEIMTPRHDMIMLPSNMKAKEAVKHFVKHPYSRLPVYEKNKDRIIGILHQKDVLKALSRGTVNKKVKDLMIKAYIIPETKKLDTLLKQFQKRKQHMAMVVDEHGLIIGLVTIEDVIEEIVGEIVDETDKVEPNIRRFGKKTYFISGKTDLQEVNDKLKLKLKETEDFETIGGYILAKLGRIPKEGEELSLKSCRIIVKKVFRHRIELIEIIKRR